MIDRSIMTWMRKPGWKSLWALLILQLLLLTPVALASSLFKSVYSLNLLSDYVDDEQDISSSCLCRRMCINEQTCTAYVIVPPAIASGPIRCKMSRQPITVDHLSPDNSAMTHIKLGCWLGNGASIAEGQTHDVGCDTLKCQQAILVKSGIAASCCSTSSGEVVANGQTFDSGCGILTCNGGVLNGPGYTAVSDGCFKPVVTSMTWSDASSHCQSDGGTLAKPSTDMNAFRNFAIDTDPDSRYWWVGGSKNPGDDVNSFTYEDGTPIPVGSSYWFDNKPQGDGDCVSFFPSAPNPLSDGFCTHPLPFLCERVFP